jgi:arylsulfatase A-like enzyme
MARKRPNILVFMPDQLRADWFGPGNRVGARTPNIDALIARGVNFTRAICPSPLCGPSRACIATGLEYDRNPVPTNAFSIAIEGPNLYRQLARAGYQVLTCGKVDLLKGELDWGRDGQHAEGGSSRLAALGFTGGLDSAGKHATMMAYNASRDEPYLCFLRDRGLAEAYVEDMKLRRSYALGKDRISHPGAGPNYVYTDPNRLPDDAYQDNWIGQCGLDILQKARSVERPWYLQVNFAGPHEPVNVTPNMARSVAGRQPPLPEDRSGLPAEKHLEIRRNYTAMVEAIDAQLGRYVDFLKSSGQYDDTVVVFTSDHGEMLGDAGLWEKSVPHQASIAVPLVFAGPGVAAGRATSQPATLLDLHATALDLAGGEMLADADSRSLVPVLADPAIRLREVVFAGLGSWRIAYDGEFKVVAGYEKGQGRQLSENGKFAGADEASWRFVRPSGDTDETNDLCAVEAERCRTLKAALRTEMRRTGLLA